VTSPFCSDAIAAVESPSYSPDPVTTPSPSHARALLVPLQPALPVTQGPDPDPKPALHGGASGRPVMLLRWDPRVRLARGRVRQVPQKRR
jgi:hypothetical protein